MEVYLARALGTGETAVDMAGTGWDQGGVKAWSRQLAVTGVHTAPSRAPASRPRARQLWPVVPTTSPPAAAPLEWGLGHIRLHVASALICLLNE